MLFHSPEFIFAFLPLCFFGFLAVHRFAGWDWALLWLAGASLVFYGQWSLALAALLLVSILFNYATAKAIHATEGRLSNGFLIGGVVANLGLLGYFKYTNFLLENVNAILTTNVPETHIILPVGISFYTFIQIGFLVEVYNRQVTEFKFAHYLLFGSFFPCVTAGPIILQKEMLSQFQSARPARLDGLRIAVGLTVFGLGLAKKLVLADNIAPYADAIFNGVADGGAVGAGTAWIGALAYTLQLYFDFSGYSDMALGLGHLFGLQLPLNFDSPLKATSITDFWRRWHMTMTRFFTNYLYSPIAMRMMRRSMRNRYGRWPRFFLATAVPVAWTFVLAGLWHGAGWTFVIFGLIHGIALATNHGWREAGMASLPRPAGWLLTMAVVIVGLVFFRATNVPVALTLLSSMLGLSTLDAGAGVTLDAVIWITTDTTMALVWIAVLASIALGAPNTHQIMQGHWYSSDPQSEDEVDSASWCAWRPTRAWAVVGAVVLAVTLGSLTGDTAFLYYQF